MRTSARASARASPGAIAARSLVGAVAVMFVQYGHDLEAVPVDVELEALALEA
jgi:hypothetical protein